MAWEEAFSHSSENYLKKPEEALKKDPKSLLSPILKAMLEKVELKQKTLGQFCCNNGRETLALMNYGLSKSTGFDIADNMVRYANDLAAKLNLNADFYSTDILAIKPSNHQPFDIGLFTIGALTWFESIDQVIEHVSTLIKSGGYLLIEDSHPYTTMLATPDEKDFDKKHPKKLIYDYFKDTPWIETTGMGYMSEKAYESKTFVSFSHTLSSIFNALREHGFIIEYFEEHPIDISNMFPHLNHQGIPLSYGLVAKKR